MAADTAWSTSSKIDGPVSSTYGAVETCASDLGGAGERGIMGWSRRARGFVVLGVAVAVVTPSVLHARADTAASALATETLAAIDPLAPQDFGAATVNGLEYADPKEGLSIVDAPVPNSDGSVDLAYRLELPPGHGITPELVVQYGSGGGNGWMGEGWDLGVGEITIDTTFGAPRFDADVESESYLLDGALLVPNANDDAGANEPRVPERSDFSRQVEREYEEIIRHGDGTANYFWEVRAKDGSVRWYGGTPDSGGPVPATAGTIDESAVVRNEAGQIVTWLLSAKRDIGVNLIRYEYETVEYEFDGTNWGVVTDCNPADELCGQHTYLDRILYTDATSAIADRNGPPYEIDLLRESELAAAGTLVRADPVVDAGLGYVDVIADRLQRVEVKWGAAPSSGTTRTYTDIAARYEFTYGPGRFGKSLLSEMIQGVADLHVHEVEYYDDLTGTTTVDGFATGVDLDTAPGSDGDGDVSDITFLDTTADVSALGGGETNAGSGNLYIGFNPISPSKTFSVGVGIELGGGDTEAIVEWMDLNGDNLPDKVFLDGSTVKFRLNTTGPAGAGGDGDWPLESATGISELSKNSNFSFQVSAEAYPLVALGIGTGLGFSWSNTYFSDVNGDGLVDFVTGGTVYFNTLDADDIPTFSTSSATTPIPLDPSPLPDLSSAELAELSATLDLQSPPIDTVRRFIAPYTGAVLVDADVSLDSVGAGSTDGVRVAVQHNGTEVDDETIDPGGPTSAFGGADPPDGDGRRSDLLPRRCNRRRRQRLRRLAARHHLPVPVVAGDGRQRPVAGGVLGRVRLHAGRAAERFRGHAVHRRRPGRRVGRHLRAADGRVGGGGGQAWPRRRRDTDRPRHDPGGRRAGHVPVLDADPRGRGPGPGRAGSLAVQHPGRQVVRVRRSRLARRPRRHRLLLDDHVRVDRQPDGERGVRAPRPAARRDLPVLQPDDRSRAIRAHRHPQRAGLREGAAEARRGRHGRRGDHRQISQRLGDEDHHDAQRAPRRHRRHTEPGLGELHQHGQQVGRGDDP